MGTKIAQNLSRLASLGEHRENSANSNENRRKSLLPRLARRKAQKIMKVQ
jgi:hypothetical protein